MKIILESDYGKYITFPPIQISMISKEADEYFNLEEKIKYSHALPRRFFCVLSGSPWIKRMFGDSMTIEKHFLVRNFVLFRQRQNEKLPTMCICCFTNSEYPGVGGILIETHHRVFKGTGEQLYEKLFFDSSLWCSKCKITPVFEVNHADVCYKKYAKYAHYCCKSSRGCFECINGLKLSKTWYEDDFSNYFYY